MTTENLKLYRMKEWFANKLANEIKSNICSDEVFAILKETEKAVYAMFSLSAHHSKCAWMPKSCLIECPGSIDFYTRTGMDYETALDEFHWFWKTYD